MAYHPPHHPATEGTRTPHRPLTTRSITMELLTFLVIGLVTGLVVTKGLKYTSHGLLIDTIVGAFGATSAAAIFGTLGIVAAAPVGDIVVPVLGAFTLHVLVKYLPIK